MSKGLQDQASIVVDTTVDTAHKLNATGWAGMTTIFLFLLLAACYFFWRKISQIEKERQVEREGFGKERESQSKTMNARQDQYMSLMMEMNKSICTMSEISRQMKDQIPKIEELLKRVGRSIGRCERAQAQPLKEEDVE